VSDLRIQCQNRNLTASGKKAELIDRLRQHVSRLHESGAPISPVAEIANRPPKRARSPRSVAVASDVHPATKKAKTGAKSVHVNVVARDRPKRADVTRTITYVKAKGTAEVPKMSCKYHTERFDA
jgi:hypothetical protein